MSSCHIVLEIRRRLLGAQQISDEASPAVFILTEPEDLVSAPSAAVTAARLHHQPEASIWTYSRSAHFVFQPFFSVPPGSSLRKLCQDNRRSQIPVVTLGTYKTNWHDCHGPKTGSRTLLICEDIWTQDHGQTSLLNFERQLLEVVGTNVPSQK